MDLRIMTWNATGIMTGIPYLIEKLNQENVSICGLSEHWLQEHNKNLLDSIDFKYTSHLVTNNEISKFNNQRIGKGGVGFVWKRTLDKYIEILELDSNYFSAMKLTLCGSSFVIVQVYLPCSNHNIYILKSAIDQSIVFVEQSRTKQEIRRTSSLATTVTSSWIYRLGQWLWMPS